MNAQIIERNGEPEWAVVDYGTYLQLVEDAEMLQDIRDYDAAKRAVEEGEELVPSHVVYAILDGGNPVKVWRAYRGLTQQALAEVVGISPAYLSQIETGKRVGSTEVLTRIANALDLSLDDVVAP